MQYRKVQPKSANVLKTGSDGGADASQVSVSMRETTVAGSNPMIQRGQTEGAGTKHNFSTRSVTGSGHQSENAAA